MDYHSNDAPKPAPENRPYARSMRKTGLALWDCDADVEVVRDGDGHPQDIALDDPRILPRLQVQLRRRRINVTTVPSSACSECKKEALAP